MKKIFCNFFKDDDGQAFSKIYVCFQNLCYRWQPKSTFSAGVYRSSFILLTGISSTVDNVNTLI